MADFPFPAHKRDLSKELGPEDCTVCGINRSICLDTECQGDIEIVDGTPVIVEYTINRKQ